MKWAIPVLVAWLVWMVVTDDGTSSLERRVNALECLSGQNCARIDTLEAYYAGRTDAEVR